MTPIPLTVIPADTAPEPQFKDRPLGRKLRCAFVHSPDSYYADTQNYGAKFMPVWAYTLASYLQHPDITLSLYDTRFDRLEAIAPADLILMSGINQDFGYLIKIQQKLRTLQPKAPIVLGGPICWSFHKAGDIEKLGMFDHLFIGDGEYMIGRFIEDFAHGKTIPKVIENPDRFPINKALGLFRPMMDETISRYYGAVLEVSRGCPFCCEFCDIRVLPDNNRSHNVDPDLILSEIDHMCRLGVQQVLLACDNFIGDLAWAEQVVDKLIAWEEKTGFRPSLYTWLTINLSKHERLMRKMRIAGFDMVFIGVESFNKNSLLETAKVQNTSLDLIQSIRNIQSFGYIIVAGIIFGFDSDPSNIFEMTSQGMMESGLISGDPSLLTALPGTPLYRRMQLADRLREVRYGLGGYKYQTNMRYLLPRQRIIDGYKEFVKVTNSGRFQYQRLKQFLDCLDTGHFVPLKASGYGSLSNFFKMVITNRAAMMQMSLRLFKMVRSPERMYYSVRAAGLTLSRSIRHRTNLMRYAQFWFFAWSNSVLKYSDLNDKDFDIDSVPEGFNVADVLPENYESSADEAIPQGKIQAQQRSTIAQLKRLINKSAP